MTTSSIASVVDHTSDAGFRAWGSEFSGQLATIGLTQTADTGQINWVTVLRPGAATSAGYEIWRFADSTIYMKFEYGTGPGVAIPQMWVTVGTGSNGSGTITGQSSTRNVWTVGQALGSTVTSYTSRFCRIADAISISWKEGSANSGQTNYGLLCIGKTVDGTGAATTTGFGVLRSAYFSSSNAQSLAFQSVRIVSTAATFTDTTQCIFFPGVITSSAVGSNTQAYTIWLNVPDVLPFAWANGILAAEEPRGTSFSVAMVGTTSHTYVSTGQVANIPMNGYGSGTYGVGLIFE